MQQSEKLPSNVSLSLVSKSLLIEVKGILADDVASFAACS